MAVYKVELDRSMCTSCGNCVDICPELFEIAEDGFSSLKNSETQDNNQIIELDEELCSADAAGSCPAMCIKIFKDGEELV
ncbi:MAG: ferredoxin [Methanomicrobiales archaeon]